MTRAKQTAYRFRRLILIAGIFYTFISIIWVFLPFANNYLSGILPDDFPLYGLIGTPTPIFYFLDRWNELGYGIGAILFFGLLFLSQWWFLRPRSGRTIQLNTTGKPLKSAVIIAAFMAMFLTVGVLACVLEIFQKWKTFFSPDHGMIVWISMLLIWFAWAGIFYVYWRQGDRYTQFGKMIRGLVAGSVIEAVVAIPVHIVATRKTQCYCEHGSYTSLVFSGTVLLWAFGPGIYLLYKREKYRQQRLFPVCDECGYDLRASKEICPECGTPVPVINLQTS